MPSRRRAPRATLPSMPRILPTSRVSPSCCAFAGRRRSSDSTEEDEDEDEDEDDDDDDKDEDDDEDDDDDDEDDDDDDDDDERGDDASVLGSSAAGAVGLCRRPRSSISSAAVSVALLVAALPVVVVKMAERCCSVIWSYFCSRCCRCCAVLARSRRAARRASQRAWKGGLRNSARRSEK